MHMEADTLQRAHWPAVNNHGPSIGQSLGLDSPNEAQKARGVIGHSMIRPACEVKLSNLPDLVSPSLRERERDVVRRRSEANTELDWMQTET